MLQLSKWWDYRHALSCPAQPFVCLFKILIKNFCLCIGVWPSCRTAHYMCVVLTSARRGCQRVWNRNFSLVWAATWVLITKPQKAREGSVFKELVLAEDAVSFPGAHMVAQKGTPVPEDLTPSPGLLLFQACIWHALHGDRALCEFKADLHSEFQDVMRPCLNQTNNLGPLQEQQVLLTTDSSLQPSFYF